jgi:hypothetical protein
VAVRVDSVPGSIWRYAGGGTTIVQLALVDSTRTPFPELLQELALAPAGMATATFEQPLPERRHAEPAIGYYEPGTPVPGGWHVYPEMAAAGLWCTPSDLCRFAIAYQRALAGEPGALLPQELAREALRPVPPGAVGLGPFVDEHRFTHRGGTEGFLSLLTASRTGGSGCAVMGNSLRCGPVIEEVADAVAERDGWPGRNGESVGSFRQPAAEPIPYWYAGVYRTDAGEAFEIVQSESGGLALVAPDQDPLDLQFVGPTEAIAAGLRTSVEFECTDDANSGSAPTAVGLVLREPGAALRAVRV